MAQLVALPGVSFGLVEGRAVFLDIAGDRYATLPADLNMALLEAIGECRVDSNDPAIRRLVGSGLLALSDSPRAIEPVADRLPRRGLPVPARPALRPGDLCEAWFRVARCARQVRKGPLRRLLVASPAQPSAGSAAVDPPRIVRLATRFLAARTLVPIAPACLPDSLALRGWLTHRGLACRLVLGVRLEPFTAHCWVEAGNLVLNDDPEKIATFVPVGAFG